MVGGSLVLPGLVVGRVGAQRGGEAPEEVDELIGSVEFGVGAVGELGEFVSSLAWRSQACSRSITPWWVRAGQWQCSGMAGYKLSGATRCCSAISFRTRSRRPAS